MSDTTTSDSEHRLVRYDDCIEVIHPEACEVECGVSEDGSMSYTDFKCAFAYALEGETVAELYGDGEEGLDLGRLPIGVEVYAKNASTAPMLKLIREAAEHYGVPQEQVHHIWQLGPKAEPDDE